MLIFLNMNNNVTHSRRYLAILICAAAAAFIVFYMGRNRRQFFGTEGSIWTTDYHMTYETHARLDDSIMAVLNQVDNSASTFNPNSLISKINLNKEHELNAMLLGLLKASKEVYEASGHTYDPTVMPLVNAWGFGYKKGELPSKKMVDSLLQFVGMNKFTIQGKQLVKSDPRLQFDFSSIAKGMACDEVGYMIERNGGENYMVEIGGEVALKGHNAEGKPWHVSIDMPIEDNVNVEHVSALVLELDKGGVATSGNYRKYKEVKGKKVSHIINPLTGYSSESHLLSVTIVAQSCMIADAWATACMVMGIERTRQLFGDSKDLGVMTISSNAKGDFVVWSNYAFASKVVKK